MDLDAVVHMYIPGCCIAFWPPAVGRMERGDNWMDGPFIPPIVLVFASLLFFFFFFLRCITGC